MNRYLLSEAAQNQIESRMDDTPFETEDENEAFVFGLCTAFNELNSVPAADVRENVRGEWIFFVDEKSAKAKCDQCGFEICVTSEGSDSFIAVKAIISQYIFCPNCGADMRKEENRE